MATKTILKTICMNEEEARAITDRANASGLSLSQYLVDYPDKLYNIMSILSPDYNIMLDDGFSVSYFRNVKDIPDSMLQRRVKTVRPAYDKTPFQAWMSEIYIVSLYEVK